MQRAASRATGPTIRQLKANADEISQREFARLMEKLPELDDRARKEIEYAFQRLVNKLLHPPLESLREEEHADSRQYLLEAIKRLFQIRE